MTGIEPTATTSSTSTGAFSGSAGHADRAAGVPAGATEDVAEQLAGPVGHLRLAGESGRAGHVDHDLDDPGDRVQLTRLVAPPRPAR